MNKEEREREIMNVDFYAAKIDAFELLKQQKYEKLTKKQLTTLIEKINDADDIQTVVLIIDLMKLFLKTEENKENE